MTATFPSPSVLLNIFPTNRNAVAVSDDRKAPMKTKRVVREGASTCGIGAMTADEASQVSVFALSGVLEGRASIGGRSGMTAASTPCGSSIHGSRAGSFFLNKTTAARISHPIPMLTVIQIQVEVSIPPALVASDCAFSSPHPFESHLQVESP